MTEPESDSLHLRLKAWGQTEIMRAAVRWTPDFLRLKATLARREQNQNRAATIEHISWVLAVAASLFGVLLTRSTHGWSLIVEQPTTFLPVVCSLGLLGRSLWLSLEA